VKLLEYTVGIRESPLNQPGGKQQCPAPEDQAFSCQPHLIDIAVFGNRGQHLERMGGQQQFDVAFALLVTICLHDAKAIRGTCLQSIRTYLEANAFHLWGGRTLLRSGKSRVSDQRA